VASNLIAQPVKAFPQPQAEKHKKTCTIKIPKIRFTKIKLLPEL
jgi:hypothetical protein